MAAVWPESDRGCASGAIEGTDFELSRDGVYGYAPGPGKIAVLARNAPRMSVRALQRRCLTATTTVSVGIRGHAPLRKITVRLDGRVRAVTRRRRLRIRIPRGAAR